MENIRKEAPRQMMFADDVVLCAREKCVLELELEQWREALEKRGMKVSRGHRLSVDGTIGGRWQGSYATRETTTR